MSTKVIRATGANVSPSEDARLYNQMFKQDGFFNDPDFSLTGGNHVLISSMYGIMQGRDFITDPMTIEVELPTTSSADGSILLRFDTTTPEVISVYGVLEPYEPVYEDINGSGTVCEMKIAQYTAGPTGISYLLPFNITAGLGGMTHKFLGAGNTTISFTNTTFNNNTFFDIYTDDISVVPKGWTFANHTITIEFKGYSEAHKIGLVYKNY